ncbi:hypothetical protein, partial [Pseudophaeobacter sp.]|uniref:hypothetical protein n=1 Tax=Pseudophaeobacter sp. TaxID=1971739 RepID=UPI0026098293
LEAKAHSSNPLSKEITILSLEVVRNCAKACKGNFASAALLSRHMRHLRRCSARIGGVLAS